MHTLGATKQSRIWPKIKQIADEILIEESILNQSVEKLARDTISFIEKLFSYLDRHIDKLEKLNWRDLEKKLEEYAKEPYSKIAVLTVGNATLLICMLASGVVTNLLPRGTNIYLPIALGAEQKFNYSSQGLKLQDNKALELEVDPENNSLSEMKCEKDRKEGRCSELCADIEQYIKMTKDMSDEEKRAWQKVAKELASKKSKRAANLATNPARISCKESNDGHPSYSDTKGKHMDEDCCPDPDEWPEPGCIYSARGLALMLKGPPGKKK
jgi:hypothetical protein